LRRCSQAQQERNALCATARSRRIELCAAIITGSPPPLVGDAALLQV
jgi:hypothetical protein